MRVYTSKLPPYSVVTYLSHDCKRSHVTVLSSVARAYMYVGLWWSKYSTHSTICASGVLPCSACICALFNRVLLRISIWFLCHFAGFHAANRSVTLLLLLGRCMKSF